jgi:regulator of ribonuclease activity A
MEFLTADLIDAYEATVRSCATQFQQYGGVKRFHGPVRTFKTFEDNALLKKTLSSPGDGAVLVVDGAASLRCSLLGDFIANLGLQNGWAGLVIHGTVRDVIALGKLKLGVKALGSNPSRSTKYATGHLDVPVTFGGVTFNPGDWLYSDEDGIVVSNTPLAPPQSLPAHV